MPNADIVYNADIAKKPGCCDGNNTTNSGCGCHSNEYEFPQGYWYPGCPPPPPPPYPYPCPPVNPGVGSTEAQIAKLSKKSACIRKMIDNLVNKNKSITISIGCGASYNFGTYLDKEKTETDYGKSILEILQAELEAIKAKIVELTADLEVEDESAGGIEETVTTI